MNSYLLIPSLEVVFCIALLILLIVSGKRHIARKNFALFLVCMASWGFFIFMMRSSPNLTRAFFWEKLVLVSILSGAIFFFRFTIALAGARPGWKISLPVHLLYFISIGLIPSGLVVEGMQAMWYGKAPVIGPLFFPYVICAYLPIVFGAIILIRQWRRSRINDERIRSQYIVMGIAAMLIGATTDFLPSLGINLYPLGIIGNIIFCLVATTAMLRYDLLEMKVVIRRVITYSLASLIIFVILGSLVYLLNSFFHTLMSPVTLTITMLSFFIAASLFQPLLSRLRQIVDRWFFRDRYEHIQNLKRFNREANGNLDLQQLALSLVTTVANGVQSRAVYLLLPSRTTDNYTTYSYCGQKIKGRLSFPANSPLPVTLKQQGDIIDINDIDILPSLLSLTEADRRVLARNNVDLLVPLINDENMAGILLIGNKISKKPYTNEERQMLRHVSIEAAVNIDNANLYENIKQKHNDLEKAMDGVIHAVSLVVETRDPYTAGHQRRVAELARAIAREMNVSEWQTMGIHIAGLLHDVGKVAVPTEILSKPGKINQYEFSIIKNHCQVGYDILQRIEFPWPVTKAILQHHERLNGSGYPGGLAADDIIIEARILGVADVVEAISSHRPYRPALGLDVALQEIANASGTLYDPAVVDACLRLYKNNETEFDRLMAVADSQENAAVEIPA